MSRFFANLSIVVAVLLAGCGPKKEQGPAVDKPKHDDHIVAKIHDKMPETSDPRTTLRGTIQEVIKLLETENYRPIFEAYVCPEDRKAVEESGKTMDQVIQAFSEKRAKTLLKVLKDIQQKEPVISEDGSTATFKLEGELAQEAPSDTFVMVKTEGMWFIKD